MADTYRWVGMAADVAQVDTITIALTWAAADTIACTIGQKTITLTIGSDTTTAQVAESLKAMLAGEADPNTGDAGRTALGNASGEFREFTATVSGSVVTCTATTPGKPFVLGVVETTAGDGTSVEATTTASSGSHYADEAANWYNVTDSTYEVPANGGDAEAGTIVFEQGDTDCLYALTALTDVSPATFDVRSSYTGKIGLARINKDDTAYPYPEYRATNFAIGSDADDPQAIAVAVGVGAGAGSSRINLDFGDCEYDAVVYKTATREDSGVPSVLLEGSHTDSTLSVVRGDVGAGVYAGKGAHFAVVDIGYMTNQTTDADVFIGSDCNVANAAIVQGGGELTLDSTTSGGTVKVNAGTCDILSGAHADVTAGTAGTVNYISAGTITQAYVYSDGTLDFRKDARDRTVTNITVYKDANVYDNNETVTWSNNMALKGCTRDQINFGSGTDVSTKA